MGSHVALHASKLVCAGIYLSICLHVQATCQHAISLIIYAPRGCAAPGKVPCQGNTHECLSKLKATSSLRKIIVTCKSPVGDISAVTLIRTDTTLDHSQKAEKVWRGISKFNGVKATIGAFACGVNAWKPTCRHAHHSHLTCMSRRFYSLYIMWCIGSCSEANYLLRNSAMDDSIGGS